MQPQLAIGIVTDIHHGVRQGTKVGTAALPLLAAFGDWTAGRRLDLVAELGDRINDMDGADEDRLTAEVMRAMAGIRQPRVHLLGNHDNAAPSRAAAEAVAQVSFASSSRDVAGFHLVFWNADTVSRPSGFAFTEPDLDWLAADLAATELPTVVFSHIPLDNGSMAGNYYFETVLAGRGHYADGHRVRQVLEASGKVVLCVAGHTHWNARNTIDGIHYVTIQSLTESFTTWPEPAGAWAELRLGEHIEVEVFGRDPILQRLPMRRIGTHWASLTRPYAPRPDDLSPTMKRRLAAAGAISP